MNPSAQAFIERLQRGDIRYMEDAQPDGSHYVAVEVAGKSGKLYNIAMVFSADGAEFGMRCYKLGQVPTERVRPDAQDTQCAQRRFCVGALFRGQRAGSGSCAGCDYHTGFGAARVLGNARPHVQRAGCRTGENQ